MEAIKLTLEQELVENNILNDEEEKAIETTYDDSFTPEEQKMIDEFSKKIDVTQSNVILSYGSAAQNKIAEFSGTALKSVKTKETGVVGESLEELLSQLKSFDVKEQDGIFEKMFKKTSNKIEAMKTKYNSAETNINRIVTVLESHQVTLLKDIPLLDQLYEKNLTNLKELKMYILAGQKALKKYKEVDLKEALEKAQVSGLPEDAQAANDLSNAINRFEKKLHDLELTRMVSVQMAPQIRLVQNNDIQMVEKIQSTIVNTIPLWKSQMLIALGLNHSKEAIKAQNEVTEFTNKMLKENAANLKMATIETAKQAERGIVDIETLTETNKSLIETLEEVQKIQTEGRKKRKEAQRELHKIERELKTKLTDIRA